MTKDEFEGWKSSRITNEVLRYLSKIRAEHQYSGATACLGTSDPNKIALTNTFHAGICSGLSEIIDLEWFELGGETSED